MILLNVQPSSDVAGERRVAVHEFCGPMNVAKRDIVGCQMFPRVLSANRTGGFLSHWERPTG